MAEIHDLIHEFTGKKVSPWGGIKYFQQTYERSGVKSDLLSVDLPEGDSNRSYAAIDVVEGFMASVVMGSRRLSHSSMLRADDVVQSIFGWQKGMASQSTFSRFFNRFDLSLNDQIFTQLMKSWWERVHIDKMTIDIDSSVMTRHGHQEGVKVGYNPAKPGRGSHHPLMAFCAELRMVVNAWMRDGNTTSSDGMDCFIDQLVKIVPAHRIGMIRGDSGFYNKFVLFELEEKKLDYIIRAKMTGKLKRQILDQPNWYRNDSVIKGAHYCEFMYSGSGWDKHRRIVAVAKPIDEPQKKTNQPCLFKEIDWQNQYEFSAYVTTSKLSCAQVHLLYNQRADCENRIQELKYDYAADGFCMKSMGATEAAFRLVMLTYNIMALFNQKVVQSPVRRRLSTVRFQCIAIGSYLVRSGNKIKLKLAAEGKRRHFLEHIFQNVETLKPPFVFSNA